MLNAKKVHYQINKITEDLINTGLCDAQNAPSVKVYPGSIKEICVKSENGSIFLKSIPYADMFKQLNEQKNYNFKMIDGALITMQYRFKNDVLIAHRLSFFPAPNFEAFQSEPDVYWEDEIYSDILDRRIVTIPIRFDFDIDEDVCEPITHPKSHLTLGQYKNCRIPVSAALTPSQFLSFIIINFYHTAHKKFCGNFTKFNDGFDHTIFEEEKKLLHINTPIYK